MCQGCGAKNFSRQKVCYQCGAEPVKQQAAGWWCSPCNKYHAGDVYKKCPYSSGTQDGGKGDLNNGWNSGNAWDGNSANAWQGGGQGYAGQDQQGKGQGSWSNETQWSQSEPSPKGGWPAPQPAGTQEWWSNAGQGPNNSNSGGGQGWGNSGGQNWGNAQGRGPNTPNGSNNSNPGSGQGWGNSGGQSSGGGQGNGGQSWGRSWKQDWGDFSSGGNQRRGQDKDQWSGRSGGKWWSQDQQAANNGNNGDGQQQQEQNDAPPGKTPSPDGGKELFSKKDDPGQSKDASWTQKCGGCGRAFPYGELKKTQQLSGNTRKDYCCDKCYKEFQHSVYKEQMMDNMTSTLASVNRFDNWSKDQEIKEVLCSMMVSCASQLGFQLQALPEARELLTGLRQQVQQQQSSTQTAGGSDDQTVGKDDGPNLIVGLSAGPTVNSLVKVVDAKQSLLLVSSVDAAEGKRVRALKQEVPVSAAENGGGAPKAAEGNGGGSPKAAAKEEEGHVIVTP